jgi:hypothetical protein
MDSIYTVSVWLLPVLIAITFHEAAHGYVARFLGEIRQHDWDLLLAIRFGT